MDFGCAAVLANFEQSGKILMVAKREIDEQADGFVLRACCRTAPERIAFVEPIALASDEPADRLVYREAVASDLSPDQAIAFHEAGHAIVGLLFGMTPEIIEVSAGNFVRWTGKAPSRQAAVLMVLAGDFAAGIASNSEHRPLDAELLPWLALVRSPGGGFCDRCRIVRALIAEHGIDASNETILAAYRAAEVRALAILSRPDVRAAIRAVAAKLMDAGRLSGDIATTIAARFITPGSISHEGDFA